MSTNRNERGLYRAAATMLGIVLALVMTVSPAVPAQAQTMQPQEQEDGMRPGYRPETALAPTGAREVLAPNETRWYTFRYVEGADEENPTDATVELTMARPGSVDFEAWTQDDVRRWRNGEDFDPTGAGTPAFDEDYPNDRDRSRLTWVGSGAARTTWYIVVENATASAAPFTLNVSGPAVVFPQDARQMSAQEDSSAQMTTAAMSAETAQSEETMSDTASSDTASSEVDVMGGTGPETALAPTGTRRTLAPNETRWYTFKYAEGVDAGDEDANDPSEAIVEAAISRPNAIDFEVWTENDVRMWRNGVDFTPTGAGTPAFAIEDDDSDNRDRRLLRWVGSGAATTTWYILLENNSDAPASYRLTITGPDVYFPERDMTATEMTASAGESESADTAMSADTMAQAGGTGPNDAFTPMGRQRTIGPDEMQWYTFDYTGGADDDNPEDVLARLRMAEPGSVSFEVWTEDDVSRWQDGVEFEPTGAGTPAFTVEDDEDADNRDRAQLTWLGSGQATTTWYIVVENETNTAAPYRLTVTGPDVSF